MAVFVGLDMAKKVCECHSHSDGPDSTRYQMTRMPQEDMAPTDQGRHDGCGCCPGYGPRLCHKDVLLTRRLT